MSHEKCSLKKRFALAVAAVGMLVASFTIPANAANDGFAGWKLYKTLTFYPYISIGSTSLDHFNEAFWNWNKENSTYKLKRATAPVHYKTNFYELNDSKDDGTSRVYKVSNPQKEAPGPSYTFRDKTSGRIVNAAAINLNPARPLSNGAKKGTYDVWTVFIHEAGHVLGLEHPKDWSTDSVMNVYPVDTMKRTLTSYDKAKIKE